MATTQPARTDRSDLIMETPASGLHASPPEILPFAPSLEVRAFLLERSRGNILIYSVPELEADAEAIEALGGIERQYLNHGHEAMFASDWVRAPLFVHQADAGAVEAAHHVRGSFSRRHVLDEDFEVIPTPGHTPGATAYLWDSGEGRLLFTGDTIYLSGGEWRPALLASSDRAAYLESLELLRGIDFDLLVPWAAGVGEPYVARTDRRDARRRISRIMARLWREESS
jgi:glyoxylase-like metal-dependent hydrolase (beta-lactamase superfamily II)